MGKNTVATIYDVAGIARVSMATVSRVLNVPDKVNQETRDRVLKIIEEIGYKPNPIARELATKKRIPTIGIIVSDITNKIVPYILDGVFEASDELNYSIKISPISKNKKFEVFLSNLMVEKVDGFIFLNDNLENDKISLMEKTFANYKITHTLVDINDSKIKSSPQKFGASAIKFLKKNI